MRPTRRWAFEFILVYAFFARSCDGKTIKYHTYEEDAPDTVIGNLANDIAINPSLGNTISFRMMKQFNASFIKLRGSDGQLTVGERIDREKICKRTLQCLITFDVVSFSKEQFQLIHVEVEIKDINDHSPEFPNRESTLEISEISAVGSRIPLDVAVDEDVGSNYIQKYQISANSHFTIDVLIRADGVKYAELVLMKELDRETQSVYTVELMATDGGNPPKSGSTTINIRVQDFNDNKPIFDQNNFSVNLLEDSPPGFLLLNLHAVDPDEGLNGEVVYGFGNQVSPEIKQLFKVDRRSGRLTLESTIDFESKITYEFDVQALDLGHNPIPSICKIIIHVQDVNDNAPEISITPMTSSTADFAYISEAAAKDSLVALISTSDRDSGANGKVHCTLYGHDHFKLQQAYEDSYMIVTAAPLDRERIAEYNLTVVAEDFGSPPFRTITQYTIKLSDENDNAPLFSKPVYEVSVIENNAPGAYITTVVARDFDLGNNGKVVYKLADTDIMGSPASSFVSLDLATGSVFALRSFNYEVMKHMDITIQAVDGGVPSLHSSAVVSLKIVDQNDNAPSITQPVLNNGSAEIPLLKNAPSGNIITQVVASDADEGENAQLSYSIAKGDDLFSIDKFTGQIRLNRAIHSNVNESLTMSVTVSDNGIPSLASTVTIRFIVKAGGPINTMVKKNAEEDHSQWDTSIIIIVVLAGSCSVLLLAIILIATTCNRHIRRKDNGGFPDEVNITNVEGANNNSESLISNHNPNMYEARPYSPFARSNTATSHLCEEDSQTTQVFESENRTRVSKPEGYSTLPGYGKEVIRPITIWKGNSYTTISARDPQFSGKDSGKGDSDFNDSDSDISGDGIKKHAHPADLQSNSLWACTSECRVLGHSDRCWNPVPPSASHPSCGQQHLSFDMTASLPRDSLRRENYYQAHIPKTVGLQSVYEKVLHRERDYVLVSSPRPDKVQEMNEISIPVYGTTTESSTNDV